MQHTQKDDSSPAYKSLCTEYYDIDKPHAPSDALFYYLERALEVKGPILEPMCGTGRFLIPLCKNGFSVTGFDSSPHMIFKCREKCEQEGISCTVKTASFEQFFSHDSYGLVMIPSSSLCLLTQKEQIHHAFRTIFESLMKGGKFIFEIETLYSKNKIQNIWEGRWVEKPCGAKIVLHSLSQFDEKTQIDTTLYRYELWEKNLITRTEVEEFPLKLYHKGEIEILLKYHGFTITNVGIPYTRIAPQESAQTLLYECIKP